MAQLRKRNRNKLNPFKPLKMKVTKRIQKEFEELTPTALIISIIFAVCSFLSFVFLIEKLKSF